MLDEKPIESSKSKHRKYEDDWSDELKEIVKEVDEWNFDIFALADACDNKPLEILTPYLLERYGLIEKFHINRKVLQAFIRKVEIGYAKYRPVYHTNLHGVDVLRNVHYMLKTSCLKNYLTDLEIFSTLVAAACHDYEHMGTTNGFLVATKSDLAMIYNDRSVQENHHISGVFFVLQHSEYNILSNLTSEEYHKFRHLFIEVVLATDMAYHFDLLKQLRRQVFNDVEQTIDKSKTLALIMHACDICNSAKEWRLMDRWTSLLYNEFFAQGDREKELGLPYSPLCDRSTTRLPETQIQFIDFIVEPTLKICGDILNLFDELATKSEREAVLVGSLWSSKRKSGADTYMRPWDIEMQENRRIWKTMCKRPSMYKT